MLKVLKGAVVLLVLVLASASGSAQQSWAVAGQVVDGVTGRPVSAAIVSLSIASSPCCRRQLRLGSPALKRRHSI